MIFGSEADFNQVLESSAFNVDSIAALYHSDPAEVAIHPFKKVLAIKISMPRPISSRSPGDCDAYGSQQHFPLANMNV